MKTAFERNWRDRFDRFARRGGSEARISGWSEHGLRRRLEEVAAAVATWPPAGTGPVLDVGCGTGVYCRRLEDMGHPAVGVDYSAGMLARAREILGEDARLAAADAESLPFRDRSLGGVVNVGVLQHIADAAPVIDEFGRVTAPGGVIYLITLNRRSLHGLTSAITRRVRAWLSGRWRPERHAVRRTPSELVSRAAEAGLELVAIRGLYLFPRGFGWLERVLRDRDRGRRRQEIPAFTLPLANAFVLVLRSPCA